MTVPSKVMILTPCGIGAISDWVEKTFKDKAAVPVKPERVEWVAR
jgi:hypothetical protein